MVESAIVSPQAVSLAPDGTVEWAKNADTLDLTIMSVTKTFTAYYALESGMITDLDVVRTVRGGTPSLTSIGEGDVCTIRDLYYSAMLPSNNNSAGNIAFAALGIPGHASYIPGFVNDMEAWYASTFGWSGFVFNSVSGLDTNITSARMIGELLRAVRLNQPVLEDIMFTYPNYLSVVTGTNPRTVTNTNNTNMFDVPEWRGSKGGSGTGTFAMGTFWEDPDGGMHTIGIIGAPTSTQRRTDIMTMIADVLGEDPPDPPDPPVAGRYISVGGALVPAEGFLMQGGEPVPIT